MKLFLLKITLALLLFAGVASSCNPDPEKEYPQNISFTEYSLTDPSCRWVNLPYDENVLVINSYEELGKYISCEENSFPVIDFSKNSLLLASGKTLGGICEKKAKKLVLSSPDKYVLSIEITIDRSLYISEPWCITFLAEKMNKKNVFELDLTYLPQ
ncbi:MAG: hypothetical protein FWC10_06385 [Lentimicrobiaceae bacterium]|nr:hypothetical protein [Lentimicrobiaceae bacterium]